MLHIIPTSEDHTEDSTCICHPRIETQNGEIICIHQSFKGLELIDEGFEVGRETGISARCGRKLIEGDIVESVQGTRFLSLTILGKPVIMLPDKSLFDLNNEMSPNLFFIGNVIDDLELRSNFFYNH